MRLSFTLSMRRRLNPPISIWWEICGRTSQSSLALFDICRNSGVKRIVFVSSGGTIYGPSAQIPISETAPTDPITAYGVGKLAIEKYLALYEHLFGLDYRILRVANPFGPFQIPLKNQGVIAALISRALKNEPIEIWGDGSVVRDYIYVDDVVAALEKRYSIKAIFAFSILEAGKAEVCCKSLQPYSHC